MNRTALIVALALFGALAYAHSPRGDMCPGCVPIRAVAANDTLTLTDYLLEVSSASARTITLPACTAALTGRMFVVTRRGAQNVVLSRAGSDTIGNALTSLTLSADNTTTTVTCDGAAHWIVGG